MNRWFAACAAALIALSLPSCAPHTGDAPIAIGVRTSNCQAPFYIADQQHLYAEHGQRVSLRLVPSNTEIIEALVRGDLQMGSVPVTTAIAAIAQGAPLHIVATTGRGSDGLLVRSADGLVSVADLRGKKVATIRASILDVLLRQTLERAGLDPDRDVELVYMSKLGDMISALKTGQVQATSNTEPFMTDAERQGWGRILTYYTSTWPDHPCCVVLARDSFAGENREALQAILSAHCEATDWAGTHVGETAQIIVDYLHAFDADLVAASLQPAKMCLDYTLGPGEATCMAGLMMTYGLIDQVPLEEALVDPRPLEAALRGRQ